MVVYTTYSAPDAHIVAGRLQHEGVPTMVHQEPAGSAIGIHIGPLGEVKVLVHSPDYARALEILEAEVDATLLETNDPITYLFEDEDEDEDGDE
jgi:hypothetical protein